MAIQPDLFGGKTEVKKFKPKAGSSAWSKYKLSYREADDHYHRCKNCKNRIRIRHRGKNYYKCRLIGDTRSAASDIRLKNVCDEFDPRSIYRYVTYKHPKH